MGCCSSTEKDQKEVEQGPDSNYIPVQCLKRAVPANGFKLLKQAKMNEKKKYGGQDPREGLAQFKKDDGRQDFCLFSMNHKEEHIKQGTAFVFYGCTELLKRFNQSSPYLLLLTAAHCVTNFNLMTNKWVKQDRVDVFYQKTQENDFERYSCSEWFIHPKYDGTPKFGYDVAILKLSKEETKNWRKLHDKDDFRGIDRKSQEEWGLGLINEQHTKENKQIQEVLTVGGYPGEYNLFGQQSKTGTHYYEMTGPLEGVEEMEKRIFYNSIHTSAGQSGGPVCYTLDNGAQVLVGIHVGSDGKLNWATKYRPELAEWICSIMNEHFETQWPKSMLGQFK